MDNYTQKLKNILIQQINTLRIQRHAFERDKETRVIPNDVKKVYYESYDIVTNYLYELLNDLERNSHISINDYQDVAEMYDSLEYYLMEILNAYGIKYEMKG